MPPSAPLSLLPFSSALSPPSLLPVPRQRHQHQHHHSTNIAIILSHTYIHTLQQPPRSPACRACRCTLQPPRNSPVQGLPRRTHAHVHPHAHALTAPQREPPAYPIQPIHSNIHSLARITIIRCSCLPVRLSTEPPATPLLGRYDSWEIVRGLSQIQDSARQLGSGSA